MIVVISAMIVDEISIVVALLGEKEERKEEKEEGFKRKQQGWEREVTM
jgi:hypothetical protein